MKTKKTIYTRMLWVFLTVVITTPLVIASAQSISSLSRYRSTSPGHSAFEPIHVVDPNADKYKLIFAKGYESKGSQRLDNPKGIEDFVQAKRSAFDNFVEELNQAGAQGYKLVSATYGGHAVGIVKFDGVQYEYDWVMADEVASALSGSNEKYERLSKRGFRLFKHFEITIYCVDDSSSSGGESCETKYALLLEKQKREEKPTPYAFLSHETNAGLTDELKQKLAEGFFPTYFFSDYQILVERTEKTDQRLTGWKDVRVVTGSRFWGGDPSKSKINELAKHGYRVAFLNHRAALMYKDSEAATPVTYVWLNMTTKKNWKLVPRKRKDFDERLATLQASGAGYRMAYLDTQGNSNLIFEQKALDNGKRREYKVLTFEFQVEVDTAAQRVNVELAPTSKEIMTMLNNLVTDGFVVRDLFILDGYSVVLERTP